MYKIFSLLFGILPIVLVASIFSDKSGYWYKTGSLLAFVLIIFTYFAFFVTLFFKGVLQVKKDTWIEKYVSKAKKKFPKIKFSSKLLSGLSKLLLVFFVGFVALLFSIWTVAWALESVFKKPLGFALDSFFNSSFISNELLITSRKIDGVANDVESLRERLFEEKVDSFFEVNDRKYEYSTNFADYFLEYVDYIEGESSFDTIMRFRYGFCYSDDNDNYECFPRGYAEDKNRPIYIDSGNTILSFTVAEYYMENYSFPIVVYTVNTTSGNDVLVGFKPYKLAQTVNAAAHSEHDYAVVEFVGETAETLTLRLDEYVYDENGSSEKIVETTLDFKITGPDQLYVTSTKYYVE